MLTVPAISNTPTAALHGLGSVSPQTIVLSADQQAALDAFVQFLLDPSESVFVLAGYSGTGKSTLVSVLLDRLDNYLNAAKLINPSFQELTITLTATTNKAAENLSQITGYPVSTIHSCLGLLVRTDFRSNTTSLELRRNAAMIESTLLFIDEASYIDSALLDWVFKRTQHCKIVFVGDPAQLTPVMSATAPVFQAGFNTAALTTVVRQAEGNPIIALATQFRHTVNTGEWLQFTPDGIHVQHLSRDLFRQAIEAEFSRSDWAYRDSKILAWTNKRVIEFNQHVRNHVKGNPHFQVGDYANCNTFVIGSGGIALKTDQLVQITAISDACTQRDVAGNFFTVDYGPTFFMPHSLADKNLRIKEARQQEDLHIVAEIETRWIDLRAVYAQTINKSQGSTYGKVFIDLDDVARCHNGNQLARMLYVGPSRARDCVIFTGDLA